MTKIEIKECLTCDCGGRYEYDGYDSIEIEENYFVIRGDCRCIECGKWNHYTELQLVREPYEIELED